ncbi:MAG: L-histidine N(alpha)-methyltransferase [Candidatus Mariimomonas ferrooxydans]
MNHAPRFKSSSIEILNCLDNVYKSGIRKDISHGLTTSQKFIPCKYFYDARGSQLFEEICCLPEYYPTKTEMSILKNFAPDIMSPFNNGDLVELGSGGNSKIRVLLDAVDESELSTIRYVPVDVSKTALIAASEELLDVYPSLKVIGIVADFTRHADAIPHDRDKLIVFFGSTIGNFNEKEAVTFLRRISGSMKPCDRFLFGLDMLKSKETLEAAYNDSKGITSEFNKNVLSVLNRELNADFNPSHFDHVAFFNGEKERVEMHLRANCRISIEISDLDLMVELQKGETIHTEICRKFSRASAEQMICEAGLNITQWYSDPGECFSLVEVKLKDS